MKTEFAADSRVGRLWRDMLASAEAAGRSREEFERMIDKGYYSADLSAEPLYIESQNGIIETAEVMDFAYSREGCYHLLAKHGFPVTFAMNDFNDKTTVDDEIRKDLTTRLDAIKSEMTASFGKRIGSNDYRKQMTLRILNELKPMTRWTEPCAIEAPDWEAIHKQCGKCTEASTVLYFALAHVGLNPVFLIALQTKPTINAISTMTLLAPETDSHAFVGVPLEKGGMIYADLMDPERIYDDRDYLFYPIKITPRQFAFIQESQRIRPNPENIDTIVAHEKLLKIAPDSSQAGFNSIFLRLDKLSREALDFAVTRYLSRFPGSSIAEYYAANLRRQHALNNGYFTEDFQQRSDDALKTLIEKDPLMGAKMIYNMAQSVLPIIKRLADEDLAAATDPAEKKALEDKILQYKRLHIDELIRAVETDPLWFRPILQLDAQASAWLAPFSRLTLYRRFVNKFPDHSHFRLKLADAALSCIMHARGSKENNSECGDMGLMKKEAFKHLRVLTERLEPDNIGVHALLAEQAFIFNEQALGMKAADRALKLGGNTFEDRANFQEIVLIRALFTGDMRSAEKALKRIEDLDPDNLCDALELMMFWNQSFYLKRDGNLLAGPKLDKRVDISLMIMDRIERICRPEIADRLRARHSLYIIFRTTDYAAPDRLLSSIKNIKSLQVQSFFDEIAVNTLPAMIPSAADDIGTLQRILRSMAKLEELLAEDRNVSLIPAYVSLCLKALKAGGNSTARKSFDRALDLNSTVAAGLYFEAVFKNLYTEYAVGGLRGQRLANAFEKIGVALDIMWERRSSLASDALINMRHGYEAYRDLCEERRERKKAAAAAERIDEITRMLNL